MRLAYTILVLLSCTFFTRSQNQSKLIQVNKNGQITYTPYTAQGDILPDFSYCGYKMGEEKIPSVPVVATLSPSGSENDQLFIQAKIDSLAKIPAGKDGFRGTILLRKGIYKIPSTIRITNSGIVLRGEGNSNEGTVLLATSPKKYDVIEIGNSAKRTILSSTVKEITDNYVPSGTRKIHVNDASKLFKVGDDVVIMRPSTAEWIHAIGMDSIPPRPLSGENSVQSMNRFRKEGANTNMNGTVQWRPESKDLTFERKIVSISNDEITLDIPLTNALQKEFGGGQIAKYKFDKRISGCGVENLYGKSVYNDKIKSKIDFLGEYPSDENHANTFIECMAVEHSWIRNVNVEHFDVCVLIGNTAKFITGQDLSAINPVSVITGGRRYAFSMNGQLSLFKRCNASDHRHVYVLGSSVAGPNAFVDGKAERTFASSEPHQRWSTGCLFDNLTLSGFSPSFMAVNRGHMGSGHGWAGAQMVFWNCSAPLIFVMQPPTAQNFAIGFSNTHEKNKWSPKVPESTIRSINGASLSNIKCNNAEVEGNGWIESPNKPVSPKSLYYQQLYSRLGATKVKSVLDSEEYAKYLDNK